METAKNLVNAQPIVMAPSADFAELYECHYTAVYRTALRITGNPADAEDVLQTIFLRILNQGEQLDFAQKPEAYFRRAAANAAIDLLRRRVSHAEIQLDDMHQPETRESTTLLKEQLRRALATLEHNDAIMFLLRYVEGLTNGELAEMFGQGKGSIAVRLHRIRQALQAAMER
ncbi:MAG: sigma-70 family RNA polymerase sigma factor [Acidobacteria bacterium]|nr:sigma-70 family RNA polymerase sigma factor [Acidobacteriota bacterium]